MAKLPRAKKNEILDHLRAILGDDVVTLVIDVAGLLMSGNKQEGMSLLLNIDEKLGGVGIYSKEPKKKLPGIFRPLTYVEMKLASDNPDQDSRGIIVLVGGYLEGLLFKCFRYGFVTKVNYELDRGPLGSMVSKIKNKIPTIIHDNLRWLAGQVYNYAKHDFDLANRSDPNGDHYFCLDECIAIYLIGRALGEEVIRISSVSRSDLLLI